jgi:hypothetical protein
MTKGSLAAQLRHRGIRQGDFSVIDMNDDAILKKYAGAYVTKETLNRLIESSLDEEHFRSMCPKIRRDGP